VPERDYWGGGGPSRGPDLRLKLFYFASYGAGFLGGPGFRGYVRGYLVHDCFWLKRGGMPHRKRPGGPGVEACGRGARRNPGARGHVGPDRWLGSGAGGGTEDRAPWRSPAQLLCRFSLFFFFFPPTSCVFIRKRKRKGGAMGPARRCRGRDGVGDRTRGSGGPSGGGAGACPRAGTSGGRRCYGFQMGGV